MEIDKPHPLNTDLDMLHNSLICGMLDEGSELPENLKVIFEDPLAGNGVGTLRVADWFTDNMVAVYFPIASDDETWTLKFTHPKELEMPVLQRIVVRDMLGRGFPVKLAELEFVSPFLRFDVVPDGVVFYSARDGELTPAMGKLFGETYDTLDRMARENASLDPILNLASKF